LAGLSPRQLLGSRQGMSKANFQKIKNPLWQQLDELPIKPGSPYIIKKRESVKQVIFRSFSARYIQKLPQSNHKIALVYLD
jgi:hypothetical protein